METLIEQEVYTFDQLSDSAKSAARTWMRNLEAEDFDTDWLYEYFETAAKILGIEFNSDKRNQPDIRWSGFWSQGDGASFVGRYDFAANASQCIRNEFPTETSLHEIADGLTALQAGHRLLTGNRISAKIVQSGRYSHEGTMSLEWVSDSETGEEIDDNEVWNKLLDLMREFARWIYKSLEAEYDYRQSEEYIDERLSEGDYEFDEDGNQV